MFTQFGTVPANLINTDKKFTAFQNALPYFLDLAPVDDSGVNGYEVFLDTDMLLDQSKGGCVLSLQPSQDWPTPESVQPQKEYACKWSNGHKTVTLYEFATRSVLWEFHFN